SASQPPSTSCLFDDSAHCEIYALSLHDALPIFMAGVVWVGRGCVVWTVPFSGAPSPRLDSPGPHAPVGALAPGVCASPSHDALAAPTPRRGIPHTPRSRGSAAAARRAAFPARRPLQTTGVPPPGPPPGA